jgi:hypothetical protein
MTRRGFRARRNPARIVALAMAMAGQHAVDTIKQAAASGCPLVQA